jgi:hypothetical protein
MTKANRNHNNFKLSVKDALIVMRFNEWTVDQLLLHADLCEVHFNKESFLKAINEEF